MQSGSRPNGNLMVGGWSSWDPELVRSGTIFFFTPLLEPMATHLDIVDEGRHDFELRALKTPLGDPLWSRSFADADEARGNALTVTPHGHIVVLGTETTANQSALVLAAYHP